jgi:hypothetical protein
LLHDVCSCLESRRRPHAVQCMITISCLFADASADCGVCIIVSFCSWKSCHSLYDAFERFRYCGHALLFCAGVPATGQALLSGIVLIWPASCVMIILLVQAACLRLLHLQQWLNDVLY